MPSTGALLAATLLVVLGGGASASSLVLPAPALERDEVQYIRYRLTNALTGSGKLQVHWTDSLGRLIEDRTIPVRLLDETDISFPLDLRRAAAMKNDLSVHFTLEGSNQKGETAHLDEDVHAAFIAKPPDRKWNDYAIIMWQPYGREQYPTLENLGINGGQHNARAGSLPQELIDNNLRWYSENIGTDFYSEYHRYRPDRIQHWSFLQAKELYRKDPSSIEAFKRHPSLWDPVWRTAIHDRLIETVTRNSPYRPFFYSLADESGIADLAAFWDFDFSDQSLVPMRRWLKESYTTLAELNSEWATNFATWDLVTPFTTHQAMVRAGDNFAPWADFKEWMDISFSDALRMGAGAVHEADPDAYINIGGGQRPGWGGYDYARITKAINAIEPYDIGNNVEIIRSLNPGMVMLSTGFENGDWERHRVWRELLHGHRGLIIWDEKHEYAGDDGKPGTRGLQASPYYNEIRDGMGAMIINSQPVSDPIAIHYSQASMRTEWMLARRPEGDAWIDRNARVERTDDEFLRLRESWCQLIEDHGLQYRFVSYGQLSEGELLKRGYRIFILPRSSSLSQAEADAVREFVALGGVAIADGEPGVFNEHSRRLTASPLAGLFGGPHDQPVTLRSFGKGQAIFLKTDTLNYLQNRLVKKEAPVHQLVGDLLRSHGMNPEFSVTDAAGRPVVGVELHVFRNGGVRTITLLSNPLLRVDELGPPDFRSNRRFEQPLTVKLSLPAPMFIYDVRQKHFLGQKSTLPLTITPYDPVILTAAPFPLPELRVSAPARTRRGSNTEIAIACDRSAADRHVLHVEVMDPAGRRARHYSGNLVADGGQAVHSIPLAWNDAPGTWSVLVRDMLSGQTATVSIVVE